MKKRLVKIIKWTFGVLFFFILSGYLYEYTSRLIYDSKEPDKNEFIIVDNRKLHFHKAGTGNVTVVFESGIGGNHRHWQEIQKEVSGYATTISYDRAGILWSDPTAEISLKRYESDLFQLLEKTNCPKPYFLVGHSFAGITLRSFIKEHSADIGGIVFIDASHPQQLKRASEELRQSVVPPRNSILNFLNDTGMIRLLFTFIPFTNDVPKDHWFNTDATNYFYKILPGLQQEIENDDVLMAEAGKVNDFETIPLTIVTASYPDGVEQIKNKELEKEYLSLHKSLQTDLISLSKNSRQVFALKSGHYITLQQPDLIIDEIKRMVSLTP